jgi:hypothetical protein
MLSGLGVWQTLSLPPICIPIRYIAEILTIMGYTVMECTCPTAIQQILTGVDTREIILVVGIPPAHPLSHIGSNNISSDLCKVIIGEGSLKVATRLTSWYVD